jgi:hypothetical protein
MVNFPNTKPAYVLLVPSNSMVMITWIIMLCCSLMAHSFPLYNQAFPQADLASHVFLIDQGILPLHPDTRVLFIKSRPMSLFMSKFIMFMFQMTAKFLHK